MIFCDHEPNETWIFATTFSRRIEIQRPNLFSKISGTGIWLSDKISKCVARADIIEFGKHNLKKLQSSMGILKRGVPSEPTLCRIENGIDALGFALRMEEFTQAFHKELIKTCNIIKMMLDIICIDGKAL